jgi:nitrite reductase (NADH) large subunit
MKKYIIIGNGVAGTTAASKIREMDPNGPIKIFSAEPYPFYTKIRLPEFLSGEIEATDLIIRGEKWHRDRGIDLHLNEPIEKIDPGDQKVASVLGNTHHYDELLLAAGGFSFIPPIEGSQKEGVFALRTIDDAKEIIQYQANARKPLLIGGGLLGLEAGNGLRKRGMKVQVVEFFQRLLPRQMDERGGQVLQAKMEEMGFSFTLGAKSKEILGEKRVDGLLLEDGLTLDCDLILISAGVRPHLKLAQDIGLEIDKAVIADDYLRTSIPHIYAAGDVVQHRGMYYGIWPASERQGEIAGINMAGGNVAYEGTVISNRLKVVGIDLVSSGEIDAEGTRDGLVQEDWAKRIYRKIVLDNDRIIGCVLLGDIRGHRQILKAIENKIDVARYKERMMSPDFDFKQIIVK